MKYKASQNYAITMVIKTNDFSKLYKRAKEFDVITLINDIDFLL